MSRLLGEHFNGDGSPKVSYADEFEARLAAEVNWKKFYQCGFCGEWHIGGYKKPKPKPKKYV